MNLRTLYVSKLAKCPLICLADLAGDLDSYENIYNLMLQGALATGMQLSEQLYTLGNAIALEFKHTAEDAEGTVTVTHSIACVPGLTDEQTQLLPSVLHPLLLLQFSLA